MKGEEGAACAQKDSSSASMANSIADAILQGAHTLRKAGVSEARREAGSLLAHVLERDRSFIISHAEDEISEAQTEKYREHVAWRARGKPLQYITGRQEFFGLEFEVTPDVLIPRPETELLIETALKLAPEATPLICDMGTGSGCIGITLAHQRKDAQIIAVDISEAALEVAKRNAARHGVSDRVKFVVSDCFEALEPPQQQFDMVVSNPPYVAESAMVGLQREVRDFEPKVALAAGTDGLSIIRRLITQSERFIRDGGHLLFEMGFDQRETVERLVNANAWRLLDIQQDLQGIPRTVALEKLS